MIADAILDLLSAPANWLISLLPAAAFNATDAAGAGFQDPSLTLGWINGQQTILTGGPGFIFNGGLLVAMLTSWLAIETAILSVRTLVWIKKAALF